MSDFPGARIYAGAAAPEGLRVVVRRGQTTVDLSTVTAATLALRDALGNAATWSATIVEQSAERLVLEHVFDVFGRETMRVGRYRAFAMLTVPAGVRRAGPFTVSVVA